MGRRRGPRGGARPPQPPRTLRQLRAGGRARRAPAGQRHLRGGLRAPRRPVPELGLAPAVPGRRDPAGPGPVHPPAHPGNAPLRRGAGATRHQRQAAGRSGAKLSLEPAPGDGRPLRRERLFLRLHGLHLRLCERVARVLAGDDPGGRHPRLGPAARLHPGIRGAVRPPGPASGLPGRGAVPGAVRLPLLLAGGQRRPGPDLAGPGPGADRRRGDVRPAGGVLLGAVRDQCPLQRGVAGVAVGGAVRRGTGPVDRHGPAGLVRRPALACRAVHDRHGPHHLLLRLSWPWRRCKRTCRAGSGSARREHGVAHAGSPLTGRPHSPSPARPRRS